MRATFAGKLLVSLPMIFAAVGTAQAQEPLFLTITNGTTNSLAVVNTRTRQTSYVPTGGAGGASGNAGGVAVQNDLAAAVNFGSTNVTIFRRFGDSMFPVQIIRTSSKPVSVAFGNNHLVVLGTTTAESFPMFGDSVSTSNDGVVQLLKSDGSAAQIVVFNGGAVYTEKSGNVSELELPANGRGGLSGPSVPVALPAAPNNNTPFGMVARGNNVYLTIAHSDLEALVVNGKITSLAEGPMPFVNSANAIIHAPCWNALYGQFLYAADSPGKQLLRYLVSDTNVFYDKPGIATFQGLPTDLTVAGSLLGVIDSGDGVNSNASVFSIDSEGELTLSFSVKIPGTIDGAAIVE